MPIPTSISYASSIIGFISFAITLLTLLGVYRDFLSAIRHAPTQIPLALGNLRSEIEAERAALRRRCREGDRFGVFRPSPDSASSPDGTGKKRRRRKRRSSTVTGAGGEVMHLLQQTVEKLYLEFKEVERPFLIRSGKRAEDVRKGDFWEDGDMSTLDVDEKRTSSKRRNRKSNSMAMAMEEEENVGMHPTADGAFSYYRTDLSHRFIWWQSLSDVQRLQEQVQRVQIRRIERDVFECDELIKRIWGRMDGDNDSGSGSGSASDDGDGPRGGGGGGSVSRRGSHRSVAAQGGRTYERTETEFVRVPPAHSRAGSVSRVTSISPPPPTIAPRRRSPSLSERDLDRDRVATEPRQQKSSNTARRRVSTREGGALRYEEYVVERSGAGRDSVVYVDLDPGGQGVSPRTRSRPGPGIRGRGSQAAAPAQSYYRERGEERESDRRKSRGGSRSPSRGQGESRRNGDTS